jgi:DNA-binding response OmpR family regulator
MALIGIVKKNGIMMVDFAIQAEREQHDVIIMDRMLPGDIDGLAIFEVLRKTGKRTPILILSALSDVDDRIRGLRSDCAAGRRA